jgi:putative nucleotidyltransferase with HDIG domain
MELVADMLGRLEALRTMSEYRHERCVSSVAEEIALLLGIDNERSAMIGRAALLHDIGKLVLPDAVLNKPSALSSPEGEMTKMHSKMGYEILHGSKRPDLELAALIALRHHEHADGTGYPDGLRLDEIPIEARIVTIADVYSALREPRVCKPGLLHSEAFEILTHGDERLHPQFLDADVIHIVIAASDRIAAAYTRGTVNPHERTNPET